MVGNEKENMENSRVLVVGLGRSGIAAAEALKRLKADVSVYDSKFSEEKDVYKRQALYLQNFMSDALMTEISLVGGFLIFCSGLSILEVKAFKTMNLLPSLLVPVIFFTVKSFF